MQTEQSDSHLSVKHRKAVLFVPFWRMDGHVGNNRVDRFVRWLSEDGYELIVIRAGMKEAVRKEAWGQEITVVDRLGLYRETPPGQAKVKSPRKPNKLRRALAYWLFNPDPTVVWAKAAARHPAVIASIQGADFILSSSPPESTHVGAWMLSQKTGVPHIMDMRDGWLDEPLKPLLITSALRQWQEGCVESRIAHAAAAIQVTSGVWKKLFDARYPHLAQKVHVLTNGYPRNIVPMKSMSESKRLDDERVLIHAGRFMGSRSSQKPDLLLDPLLRVLSISSGKGVIRFYGNLNQEETSAIECYRSRFWKIGWRLEFPGAVPRSQMLAIMEEADGLLLLSASHAALPSKLFEYAATGKPVLYVTERHSATEELLSPIPQAINLMNSGRFNFEFDGSSIRVPEEYSESLLRNKFNDILQMCVV